MLVDLGMDGLNGKTAEDRLEEVGITVNRNAIPFDERPPMHPVGSPDRHAGPDHPRLPRGRTWREIAAVIVPALRLGYDDVSAAEGPPSTSAPAP